jgi:diacylglycerol kinase (ATP)
MGVIRTKRRWSRPQSLVSQGLCVANSLRLLAIVNPISGKGRARALWPMLEKRLTDLGVDHSMVWTEYQGHAITVAEQAAGLGYSRVLSVGGDGTLREVVQGALSSGVEIGVIPAGSGNDFSRTIGVPRDPIASLHVALGSNVSTFDIGELNGAVYVNVAGCGIDAEVAALAASKLRFLGGKLSYLAATIAQVTVYRPRRFDITIDGERISRLAYLIAAANGRFYGGGMMIAPTADPSDGLFDICIIRSMPRPRLIANLSKVYGGGHIDDPFAEMHRGRVVTVETDVPVHCQADGEVVAASPVQFRVSAQKIRVACPPKIDEMLNTQKDEPEAGR